MGSRASGYKRKSPGDRPSQIVFRLACCLLVASLVAATFANSCHVGSHRFLPLTSALCPCHHTAMEEAETKALVMAAWDRWSHANLPSDRLPSGNDAFKFCGYLKSEQPDLLRFGSSRDVWQVVHGWLLLSGKVRD